MRQQIIGEIAAGDIRKKAFEFYKTRAVELFGEHAAFGRYFAFNSRDFQYAFPDPLKTYGIDSFVDPF